MSTEPATLDCDNARRDMVAAKERAPTSSESELVAALNATQGYLNTLTKYAKDADKVAAIRIIESGYQITALRAKVPSGEWTSFLKTRISGISVATAYRYEEIARRFRDPSEIPDGLTVSKLYRLVKQKRAAVASGEGITNKVILKWLSRTVSEAERMLSAEGLAGASDADKGRILSAIDSLVNVATHARAVISKGKEPPPSSSSLPLTSAGPPMNFMSAAPPAARERTR